MSETDENTSLDPEYEGGTTVQVLARHPHIPTQHLWALNKLEEKPSGIRMFNGEAKPRGWGNAGGGMEDDELEIAAKMWPDLPVLQDRSLSDDTRSIFACGYREFLFETGYARMKLHSYTNPFTGPTKDGVSVLHFVDRRSGHRRITLWGDVESFMPTTEIFEVEEIECTAWIDISESVFKPFFDRILFPSHPYWRHVLSTLVARLRINTFEEINEVPLFYNIRDKIHDSWKLVWAVGAGDDRFPELGFKISPANWYRLFDYMIAHKQEDADTDFIAIYFRKEIDKARRREDGVMEEDGDVATDVSQYQLNQDEIYRVWMEDELKKDQMKSPDSL